MSEIADKIYAATGLTLGAEAAAAIGRLIQAENARLRAALQSVLDACDQGWKVERSVGGMTVEGQMRRSFYNRVPAWPIEEARAALGEKG